MVSLGRLMVSVMDGMELKLTCVKGEHLARTCLVVTPADLPSNVLNEGDRMRAHGPGGKVPIDGCL